MRQPHATHLLLQEFKGALCSMGKLTSLRKMAKAVFLYCCPGLPMLPGPFEQHWLGNLGSQRNTALTDTSL